MSNKLRSKEVGIGIDEEAKLDQNGKPDVVGTYDKRVVGIVGFQNGADEAVIGRHDVCGYLR